MRLGLVILAAVLTACASTPVKCAWPKMFDEDIARVAGMEVVDCGFLALGRNESGSAERGAALECIAGARKAGRSFKYGTVRVPMDSTAWEVLVETSDASYLFVQDEMILQEYVQQWRMQCKAVEIDPRTAIMRGEDCRNLPGSDS